MFYFAWYNPDTRRHEVLSQLNEKSDYATYVESYEKSGEAEARANELNKASQSADVKAGG